MGKAAGHAKITRSDAFLRAAMREHGAHVLRLAAVMTGSQADAEDIYQDVFVKLATFSGEFESEEHLHAWLLHVAANCCRDFRRSWWQKHTADFDELVLEPIDPASLTDNILAEESPTHISGYPYSAKDVVKAIIALPKKYRIVIFLTYYEGFSTAMIAQILAENPSTVRTRLQRARERLRTILEKQRSSHAEQ
ncbi:MAG: sigma-70 family RNA polymerase sigma factor [Coriobacteriales bacterium]|nr:sigma-70 family RNA polymerase sigma factor [Coriobacteriales bacterium]